MAEKLGKLKSELADRNQGGNSLLRMLCTLLCHSEINYLLLCLVCCIYCLDMKELQQELMDFQAAAKEEMSTALNKIAELITSQQGITAQGPGTLNSGAVDTQNSVPVPSLETLSISKESP